VKNLYLVTLSCVRHYGNSHSERATEPAMKVIAANGDEAVEKAKKRVGESSKPALEGLEMIVSGVE
jgi:hypothetical protein